MSWSLVNDRLLLNMVSKWSFTSEGRLSLNTVRFDSSWEKWNRFFLEGVVEVAENVVDTAKKLNQIVNEDRTTVLGDPKVSVNAIRLFEILPMNPMITQAKVAGELGLTKPPALKAISLLEELGILEETMGKKRDRVYKYKRYLDILALGTELWSLPFVPLGKIVLSKVAEKSAPSGPLGGGTWPSRVKKKGI